MPARANNDGTNWSLVIAGTALFITFAGGIWSLINPKGDTERLEKQFQAATDVLGKRIQVVEDALQWKYPSKELLAKDVEFVRLAIKELQTHKVDKDVYEQKMSSVDNSLRISRERVKDLEHSVNITYSAKDALQQLQGRLGELERALRDKK
jgi:EAL domain-containing protein (putative c-di-GMP-specific phosphodiesterase class I)